MFGHVDTVEDLVLTDQFPSQNEPNGDRSEITSAQQLEGHSGECAAHSAVYIYEIGVYGFRKKCLYFFLILATVTIVINAALTLWIIAALSLSMDGIGKIKIEPNRMRLSGDAFLFGDVYANSIRSRKGENIRIQSDNSVIISGADGSDGTANRLFIGSNEVNSIANQFVVRSPDGKLLFLVSDSDVVVATDKLRVNNAAGIKFNGSIQVPLVQSLDALNVLSPTRRVKVKGPQRVSLQSKYGRIALESAHNLHLRSKEKIIQFDSSRIEFVNLRVAFPTKRGRTYPGIYQLCMCAESGKLFMVPPDGLCFSDHHICDDFDERR